MAASPAPPGFPSARLPKRRRRTSPSASTHRGHFSPNGGCTDAHAKAIHDAEQSILIQAYSLPSPLSPRLWSLPDDLGCGLRSSWIRLTSPKSILADFLLSEDRCWIDDQHTVAPTRSSSSTARRSLPAAYNFTNSAEQSNAENLVTIRDRAVAEKYTENWNKHAEHSKVYEGRQEEETRLQCP